MLSHIYGRPAKIIYLLVALVLIVVVAQAKDSHSAAPSSNATSAAGPQSLAPSGARQFSTGGNGATSIPVGTSHHPIVGRDAKHDLSQPLRDMRLVPPQKGKQEAPENPHLGNQVKGSVAKDTVVQSWFGPLVMPTPIVNFNGMPNINGAVPPDTNGDVGPNHYVQIVNVSLQMFNKTGTSVYGPASISTLWSGFGGLCETTNGGDPIVMYDPMADRWLISQFTLQSPYGECIAISQTPNPTGAYYRYFFQLSGSQLYDYPKFGVWPDGYYMSANLFGSGGHGSYQGTGALVFDRAGMLQGLSASYQEFDQPDPQGSTTGSWLPSDLDGATKPPVGAPNYFARLPYQGDYTLSLFKFHVDWTTPANSTFTGSDIAIAPYNSYGLPIAQPGTSVQLGSIEDKLMFRLAYRNFGDHESLVVNHTTSIDFNGLAGIRWYEIRSPNSSPFIYQQGTYAPDQNSRWMGSIAMDRAGNMGLGYSVSSSSVYPSIRYTGRLAGDPLGTMPQGETTLVAGGGSQTYPPGGGQGSRWGDYSDMTVDPADDCTFWYTQEYYATTSNSGWQTRIGAFKFSSCNGPSPTPTSTLSPSNTPTITLTPSNTPTFPTFTNTSTPTVTSTPTITQTPDPCLLVGSVLTSPSPGSPSNYLYSVAAVSANDVWAVGYYYGVSPNPYQALIEHWNGSAWSVVPNASLSTSNEFYAVSAVSANDVWAVGYYQSSGTDLTLIEHWNGTAWSVVSSPNVPGVTFNIFNGVAAVSANDVWAVGWSSSASGRNTLIEHWNGTAWSIVASPNVGTQNELAAVAAVSANDVWSTGYYDNATLVEHWNGTAWSMVASPSVGSSNELYGVSAISANDVWAVGTYNNGTAQPLIEHWNGTTWSMVANPGLPGAGYLTGVSVISANNVWTVGRYGGGPSSLVEHWNGTAWTVVASPNPSGSSSLYGTATLPNNEMWAVGNYSGSPTLTLVEHFTSPCGTPTNTRTITPTFTVTPTITRTSTVPTSTITPTFTVTPTPTLTSTVPTSTNTSTYTRTPTLTPTPCGGGNYLAATGAATIVPGTVDIGNHCDDCLTTINLPFSYQLYDQTFTALALDSNGKAHFPNGTSLFTNVCLPSGGYSYTIFPYWDDLNTSTAITNTFTPGIYTSITGASPNRIFNVEWRTCIYDGGSCNAGTANFELRLYEGQSRFDIVYGTLTNGNTGATSGVQKDGALYTQYFCNAVGGAATGSVVYTPAPCYTVTPTNTPTPDPCAPVWSLVSSPNVGTGPNELLGVGVVSSNDVWGVGFAVNSGANQTMVQHWNGTAWSVVPSPNGGTFVDRLYAVSVVSSNDIWAVGYTYNASNGYLTLIEHWNGTDWSVVSSPNGTGDNFLNAVAGVSSNDVWAVGYSGTFPNNYNTLIEHWNGTSWSVVAGPTPPRGHLNAIAVVSANDVWAVGNYYAGGAIGQATLTEHWNGTAWSIVSSPNPSTNLSNQLNAITVVSANDVWAVGAYSTAPRGFTLIEHWNGTAWSVVAGANPGTTESVLYGVTAVSANDMWAVGYYNNSGIFQTLTEHWNGTSWSVVSSPNVGTSYIYLEGVAAVSTTDMWAVGFYTSASADQTLVEHYASPCSPATNTPTATITPTVTSTSTPQAMLVGHVTWQGPPAQPNTRQQLPITLTLCVGGAPVAYGATTDSSGFFTVTTSLPTGNYNWRVKGAKYLATAGTALLTAGTITQVEMGQQRAGDTDNTHNNVVNTTDFSVLKGVFGQASSVGDLNNDGVTNTTDFNLLKGNFGQSGAAVNCP